MSVPQILKPRCKVQGQNYSIYSQSSMVAMALKRHGLDEHVREMFVRVVDAKSPEEAAEIFRDYVDID